jgi:predicted Rossmann-fold nucleotide-binding protein
MQAASDGAASVDQAALGRSVGIRIELPFEQEIEDWLRAQAATKASLGRE